MKKTLLILIVLSFGLFTIAQERAVVPKAKRDISVKMPDKAIKFAGNTTGEYIPGENNKGIMAR